RLGVLVGGVGLVAIGVDPDHLATLALLGGGQGPRTHGTGHRHHDVRAGGVEFVGDGLALGLSLQVAGDGALLRLLVPAHRLDVGVVGVVVGADAVHEAVQADGHGRGVGAGVGGGGAGGGRQQEGDREDQVAAFGDHVVDGRREVGVGGGLGGRVIDAVLVHGVHQAVVAGFVEGLVVPAAGVGDHAGLEIGRGAVASPLAVALCRGGATGG